MLRTQWTPDSSALVIVVEDGGRAAQSTTLADGGVVLVLTESVSTPKFLSAVVHRVDAGHDCGGESHQLI